MSEEKKQTVLALGRLGWSLRRIEQETKVRRETASLYLRAAGIAIRAPRDRQPPKPASRSTTDPGPPAKPASRSTTDLEAVALLERAGRSPIASACEPYRELVELGLRQGRNAVAIWQDLVTDHGFAGGTS